MSADTTAFAWLEIPSTSLGSSFGADFHFAYEPAACPNADNVTPPRPKTLQNVNPKSVAICTRGGTWQISGNVGNFRVAGGPLSQINSWPDSQDQASWAADQDVLLIAIRYKPA